MVGTGVELNSVTSDSGFVTRAGVPAGQSVREEDGHACVLVEKEEVATREHLEFRRAGRVLVPRRRLVGRDPEVTGSGEYGHRALQPSAGFAAVSLGGAVVAAD